MMNSRFVCTSLHPNTQNLGRNKCVGILAVYFASLAFSFDSKSLSSFTQAFLSNTKDLAFHRFSSDPGEGKPPSSGGVCHP